MENDTDNYLACPLCNSISFYLKGGNDQLHFLSIRVDCSPKFSDLQAEISLQETDAIYCTSCGWHGNYTELADLEKLNKGDS